MSELSKHQLQRQDHVDNAIYEMLLLVDPKQQGIDWNIDVIADIRDRVSHWFVEYYRITDEMGFYPYVE
jgi:hypothetical protein